MRDPRDTDFFVELPGVGTFRYGRRTLGDQIAVRTRFLDVVKGHGEADDDLTFYAGAVASHAVLCVECPAGWEDLTALDLTAEGTSLDKVFELVALVRGKEDSFRSRSTQGSEAVGA